MDMKVEPVKKEPFSLVNSSKKLALAACKKIDAYSNEPQPKTLVGGLLTVLACLGTLAYCVVLTIEYIDRPWLQTTSIYWSTAGPYAISVTCMAASGCMASNQFDPVYTYGVAISDSSRGCFNMAYKETVQFNVTFSQLPTDGISVMYDPTTTDSSLPDTFGATVYSQPTCWPDSATCNQGIQALSIPIGPGLSLGHYVNTLNGTRTDAGGNRSEWFITALEPDAPVNPGATVCYSSAPSSYTQILIRMDSSYNQIIIQQASGWLALVGTYGGAMGLFLQIGFILLMFLNFLIWAWPANSIKPARDQSEELAANMDFTSRTATASYGSNSELLRNGENEVKIYSAA